MPSTGSAVARIRKAESTSPRASLPSHDGSATVRGPIRARSRSDHERHGVEHPRAELDVAADARPARRPGRPCPSLDRTPSARTPPGPCRSAAVGLRLGRVDGLRPPVAHHDVEAPRHRPRSSNRTDDPSGAPACLPTTNGMADASRSTASSAAGPVSWPGRPVATRMSCSCTQQSITRTCMNSRYGTFPTGLGPTSSKRAAGHDRSSASRRAVTVAELVQHLRTGRDRRGDHPSLVAGADLVVRHAAASTAGSGAGSPSSERSVPTMCDSTSRTVHPGHSDGSSHSAVAEVLEPRRRWRPTPRARIVDDRLLRSRRPRPPFPGAPASTPPFPRRAPGARSRIASGLPGPSAQRRRYPRSVGPGGQDGPEPQVGAGPAPGVPTIHVRRQPGVASTRPLAGRSR